jgi:photosystem II stability/assembly factor-like uncharacterized protein
VAKRILLLMSLAALVVTSFAAAGNHGYAWQLTPTPTDPTITRLRGVSAVSESVAWASGWQGNAGLVLRTTNKGVSWQSVGPPGVQGLQFRDVEAFDADTAVIMSISLSTPDLFRIYRTENGGQTWTLVFQNAEPTAFYDCMAFFDKHRGLALSDPINGRFRILATNDGGRTWQIVNADMPPALPGEFAFAASGQCITTAGGRDAWFGTGGDVVARVFHSSDLGGSWTVANTPIRSTASGGISALAFRDPLHGLAVGGDFDPTAPSLDTVALTNDGGATWQLNQNAPDELRSGAHWVTGTDAIIVGPSGSDASFDQGMTWQRFDDGSFDTVDCAGGYACWAAGQQGRVAYLVRGKP